MSDQPGTAPECSQYLRIWAGALGDVLGKITGQAFPSEAVPVSAGACAAPAESDLQLAITTAGGLRGEMSIRLPRPAALRLSQLFMSEAGNDSTELDPTHQEACVELFRQIGGEAAVQLRPQWGEVQMRVELGSPPSWSAAETALLQAGPAPAITIEVQLSAALVAALRVSPGSAPDSVSSEALPANLSGLMDVEVVAKLRFGTREMLLRDILELAAGSVVELDRRVQEPVDLLLDGKVAARGEVVVVNGNYGIRISEVVLPA